MTPVIRGCGEENARCRSAGGLASGYSQTFFGIRFALFFSGTPKKESDETNDTSFRDPPGPHTPSFFLFRYPHGRFLGFEGDGGGGGGGLFYQQLLLCLPF
jgi:hypothetical protein